MRFAGGVADAKDAVAGAESNAGSKRPAREPRAFARRAAQRRRDAGAFAPQHRLDDVAGALAGLRRAQVLEAIGADAAGERREAVVGDDHAAVAAGEREHGQQVGGDRRVAKVGLEGEQVGRRARRAALRAPRAAAPRAVRGDDQAGVAARPRRLRSRPVATPQAKSPARRRSIAAPTAAGASRRPPRPRRRAACRGARGRARGPSDARLRPGRQRGDDGVAAAHQRDPAQLGAGAEVDRDADAERVEQREVARGDAFAADLAARKRLSLDERDRPAGARQQDRGARPGRTGADDGDVEVGLHDDDGRRAATKQWVKRPSSYSSSRHAAASPSHAAAELVTDEAGANAQHAVAARHRVRAEEEDQVARGEREAARRGSQATSASARAAQAPSRRRSAAPSK